MSLKKTMQNIHNHNYGGYRKLQKTRNSIFKLLKEYLDQKFEKKVIFFPNSDDFICDMLENEEFYPESVIFLDKHGYAARGIISSIQLTEDGKFKVDVDDAGTIYDAESYMLNDDLFTLCDTLEKYEKAMQNIRKDLAESGDWKEHAIHLLSGCSTKTLSELTDYVSGHWKNLESDDYNIIQFMSLNKPS